MLEQKTGSVKWILALCRFKLRRQFFSYTDNLNAIEWVLPSLDFLFLLEIDLRQGQWAFINNVWLWTPSSDTLARLKRRRVMSVRVVSLRDDHDDKLWEERAPTGITSSLISLPGLERVLWSWVAFWGYNAMLVKCLVNQVLILLCDILATFYPHLSNKGYNFRSKKLSRL